MTSQIEDLQKAYHEAKAASDAAYKAAWADPKNKAKADEFGRLFTLAGKARRALEAETGRAVNSTSAFAQTKAMQREKAMDRAEEEAI